MKIIHVLCISALIAATPTLLTGCSGGSSNGGNSLQTTQAQFNYTSTTPGVDTYPLKVKGVATLGEVSRGVYAVYTPYTGDEANYVGLLQVMGIIRDSSISEKSFILFLRTAKPFEQTVGKTYQMDNNADGRNFSFGLEGTSNSLCRNGSFLNSFVATGGTVEVIAKKGDYVTIRLKDVTFKKFTLDAPGDLKANGIFTYKQSDIVVAPTGTSLPTPLGSRTIG